MQKEKVVIIGSGIAGSSCAIYLKRGGLDPVIIENNAPGGTLNYIPNIQNYPGYTNIPGPDLAMNLYNQLNELKIKILFKDIKNIDLEKKTIDNEISFDYLIIATGRKNKLLNIENEKEYIGKGISTCALCDGAFYKGKEVSVVGGGSSALTDSLYLAGICKKVNIIVRKDKFSSSDEYLIEKVLNTKNIKVIYNANITKYNIKDNKLISVSLDNKKKIKCDGIFLAIGSTPNSSLFNVNKDNAYIIVNKNMETNIDNIFAIGDVIKKDYYQLTTAAFDGTICANTILKREKQIK